MAPLTVKERVVILREEIEALSYRVRLADRERQELQRKLRDKRKDLEDLETRQ